MVNNNLNSKSSQVINNNNNNNNSLENLLNSSQSFSPTTTLTSELSLSSILLDPCFRPLSPPLYDHSNSHSVITPSDSPSLSHELSASSICSPELDFFNDFCSHQSPFDSDCALHAQLTSPLSPFDLAQGLGLPIPNIHLTDLDLHNALPLPSPLDQLSPSNLLAHSPFNNNNDINNNNNNNLLVSLDSPTTDLAQKPSPSIFDHSLPNSIQVLQPTPMLPEQNFQLATRSLPDTASPTSSDPPSTSPDPPFKKKPGDRRSSSSRTLDPREDFLKRNRVAASKSRAKKKEWQENLEARAQGLGKENLELKKQVRILTVELERLQKLLDHDENFRVL